MKKQSDEPCGPAAGGLDNILGLSRETPPLLVAAAEVEVVVATRSQEGHMVRVVAGSCLKKGSQVFKALSSCSSFCNLLFSSVRLSQHLFKYSQSTSVCFNFVLSSLCFFIRKKKKKQKQQTWFQKFSITLPFCSETKPPLDGDGDLTLLQEQVFVSALFLHNK